jgi:hypothetical protein
MALWGKKDGVALTGTVDVTAANNEIVGTGTAFTTEAEVETVVTVGGEDLVIKEIVSDTVLRVEPAPTATLVTQAITESESPKYLDDAVAINDTSLVGTTEAQDANNRIKGIKSPGWTTYVEYVDAEGNTRHKVETLVALKS